MEEAPGRGHRWLWLLVSIVVLALLGGGGVLVGERMATVGTVASASLLTALPAPPTASPGLEAVAELALSRTVTVEVVSTSQEQLGTAWLLDAHGDFVTNAHVVSGHVAVRLRQRNGTVLDASVLGVNTQQDIAVLHSAQLVSGAPLPLDGHPATVGQAVVVIASGRATGHGDVTLETVRRLGVSVTATNDIASPSGGPGTYTGMIQLQGKTVYPGNSGGPVLDSAGQVVGILTLATPGQPIAYAIPITRVAADLTQLAA